MSTTTQNRVLSALNWRYATKQFDTSAHLTEEQIHTLLESISLTPTAYGQQPFRAILVETPALREALIPASYGQDKVLHSSLTLVLAARTDLGDASTEAYMALAAQTWGMQVSDLAQFEGMVKGFYGSLTAEQKIDWAKRQAYIAMGTVLTTAALEEIDACPMEGIVPAQVDAILGLADQNLTTAAVIVFGKRSAEDKTQHHPKVRVPLDTLVIRK